MRSIFTARRELFHWNAILFTLALGTAAGGRLAERLKPGGLHPALIFGAGIALVALAHCAFRLNALLGFRLAYILTRPLGASFGDLLSQPSTTGGPGLGTAGTSVLFLTVITASIDDMTAARPRREAITLR